MVITYQNTQPMLYPLIRKYNARKKGNMLENKLYTTHLVFDLTSAKCVNVHESTNNNITHY